MSRNTCNGCDQKKVLESFDYLMASVQASRDTGCCVPFGTDDDHTLTRSERIGYWMGVGAAVGLSVITFFGAAGYLVGTYLV